MQFCLSMHKRGWYYNTFTSRLQGNTDIKCIKNTKNGIIVLHAQNVLVSVCSVSSMNHAARSPNGASASFASRASSSAMRRDAGTP